MGCNCKSDKQIENVEVSNGKLGQKIVTYSLKTLAFILLLVLLPIINIFIIWFMFKLVVMNKNISIKPLLLSLGKKFQDKEIEDEEEEFDDITEDDVVMVNVEDITNKSK